MHRNYDLGHLKRHTKIDERNRINVCYTHAQLTVPNEIRTSCIRFHISTNTMTLKCDKGNQTGHFMFLFYIISYTLLSLYSGNSGLLTRVRMQQPQEQRCYPDLQVHDVFSCFYNPLTWTTGSLTCERDHSYACVYTQGSGIPTMSQHNI